MRSPRHELVTLLLLASACDAAAAVADLTADEPPAASDQPSGNAPPDADAARDEPAEPSEPEPLVLEAPQTPLPDPRPPTEPEPTEGRRALAWQFNAPIYVAPGSDDILGFSRRGSVVPVTRARNASGCSRSWWELQSGGWVCPNNGWSVSSDPTPLEERLRTRPPEDAPLPFGYAKVRDPDTPLYARMPTAAEQAKAEASPGVKTTAVLDRTEGVVFLALHREETRDDGTVFLRDVRGRYVLKDHTHPPKVQTMRGEPLESVDDLPIAFVHTDDVPVTNAEGTTVGTAEKFARQPAEGLSDDGAFVLTPAGRLPLQSVRLAERVKRPDDVDADEQWVHVDLDRQVLVAYEGDRPVLATLVSSGKAGYEPPRGLFRIEKKYTTRKMQGADPTDGSYDIDQVPYTMYYWGSLALHGAYWHDDFGKVRSHGCTNLPPHDARWLFRWASPTLPHGWHGRVRARGPHVYMTRGDDVYVDPLPAQRKND